MISLASIVRGAFVVAAGGTSPIAQGLASLLAVFVVAAAVGTLVAKVGNFPYTIALLLAGLVLGSVVTRIPFPVEIRLTHDVIVMVILPVLLFEGASTTDLGRFRRNLLPVLALAIPGLLLSVVLLGSASAWMFGYPLVIGLLLAAMILPTDPVSVLALFEELGAPDRLAVLVEGESLVNDGVGVVLFATILTLVEEGATTDTLLAPARALGLLADIAVTSAGGAVVGLAVGFLAYQVMVNLDEAMTEVVITLVLAYGSFLLAHRLGVSGVIAVVVAGLFIGNRGAEYAMSARTKVAIFNTWDTAAFVVNTFIFVAIGITTPVPRLVEHARLIALGVVLVVATRAAIVYPFTAVVNRWNQERIPWSYQHVMVWGGLHGSIPIALALGLPPASSVPGFFPREELTAVVFGVAGFSLVVQGLTMSRLLDRLDLATRSDAQQLYELLTGRSRAVRNALDAAEELHADGEIPRDVYEDFETEYGEELDDLNAAIASLMEENPELRRERLLAGERQVLQQEKSAIMDAIQSGVITNDVGEQLAEEVDLKLARVRDGESTVRQEAEGYEEFWRERTDEFGLDFDEDEDESDETGSEGGDGGSGDGEGGDDATDA